MNFSSIRYGNYGGNYSHANGPESYRHKTGTSFSAIPKVWSNTGPPRFQPFFSPQALNHRPIPTDQMRNAYEGFPNRFRPATDAVQRKDYEESISEAFSVSGQSQMGQDHDRGHTSMQRERKDPVSLHMWIISPAEDRRGVWVEGKRSLLDEHFWHSDVIRERLDEKTVVTVTGSIYRLEGNMELMDAMAVGFSRSLVEAFWLGFPPDWKALIDNHFQTVSRLKEKQGQTEPGSASHVDTDDDVSFVDSVSIDNIMVEESNDGKSIVSNPTRPPDRSAASSSAEPPDKQDEVDGADLRSISEDEDDDILMSEETIDSNADIPEEIDEEIIVSKKVSKPPKNLEAKEHSLSKWIIKFLANGRGIYVIGENMNGALWHSSAIEKRLSKKKLLSCTGSVYKLVGKMDKLLALNEDIPIELYKKFQEGFPKEWLEILQEHINRISKTGKKSQKIDDKPKNKVLEKFDDKKSATVIRDKNINKRKESLKKTPAQYHEKSSTKSRTAINRSAKSSTDKMRSKKSKPEGVDIEQYESGNYVITPRGQLVDLSTLGRSRSGRLIKPPLHGWARQKFCTEGDRVVVKATTAGASQFLKQFEDQFRHTTRKIQPYFNPRQKDVDYSLLGPRRSKNTTISTNSILSSVGHKISDNSAESVNVSNSEAQLSEDDDNSEDKLNSAVTSILEKNRSRRNLIHKQQRRTCYNNSVVSDSVVKEKKSCSKQTYELDESCESLGRTLVNGDMETEDSDDKGRSVRRQTRQRSKDKIIENTENSHKPSTRQRSRNRAFIRQPNNAKDQTYENLDDLETVQIRSKNGRDSKTALTVQLIDINDSSRKKSTNKESKPKSKIKIFEKLNNASRRRRSSLEESDQTENLSEDNVSDIDNEKEFVPRRRSGRSQRKEKPVYKDLDSIESDSEKDKTTTKEGKTKKNSKEIEKLNSVSRRRKSSLEESDQMEKLSEDNMSDKDDEKEFVPRRKSERNQQKKKPVYIDLNSIVNKSDKTTTKESTTKKNSEKLKKLNRVLRRRRSSVEESDQTENLSDDNVSDVDDEKEFVPTRRSGRRQQRQKPVYVDFDPIESDSEKAEKSRTVSSKKKNKACIGSAKDYAEETTEDSQDQWSQDEKQRLYRACRTVAVNHPKYWEKVAEIVESKSADSCHVMFYKAEEKRPPSKPKNHKKERVRATAVTAKKGTLKRKQQLIDVLKQQNENSTQDLFDSTPYRQTRKRKIPLLADEGDSLFDKIARLQGMNFETPRGPLHESGSSTIHPIASPVPTPGTHLKADSPAQRRDMEGYIHNILKKQKTRCRKKKSIEDTPNPKLETKGRPPSENLFYKILNENQGDKENFVDSEHEEDFYFEGDTSAMEV